MKVVSECDILESVSILDTVYPSRILRDCEWVFVQLGSLGNCWFDFLLESAGLGRFK